MQFTFGLIGMLFLCILKNAFIIGADGLLFTQYLFILLYEDWVINHDNYIFPREQEKIGKI